MVADSSLLKSARCAGLAPLVLELLAPRRQVALQGHDLVARALLEGGLAAGQGGATGAVVRVGGDDGGRRPCPAGHAVEKYPQRRGHRLLPAGGEQHVGGLSLGGGGLEQVQGRDRPDPGVAEPVAEPLAQDLLVAPVLLLPGVAAHRVDLGLDEEDVGRVGQHRREEPSVLFDHRLALQDEDHGVSPRHEALGDLGVGGEAGAETRRIEQTDPRGQEPHRPVDLDPAQRLAEGTPPGDDPLLGAVAVQVLAPDLPDAIVLEPQAVGLGGRVADAEDLSGGFGDVGRQQLGPDQGVDQRALAALGLAEDQHGVVVVLEPFGQQPVLVRRRRQLAGRPGVAQPLHDLKGPGADILRATHQAVGLRRRVHELEGFGADILRATHQATGVRRCARVWRHCRLRL